MHVQGPCAHDGLSARLIEQAGFPVAFMSGFGVSAARLGAPDTNLLSYGEVLDQGRCASTALMLLLPALSWPCDSKLIFQS